MAVSKWFWIGSRQPLLRQLSDWLGGPPSKEPLSSAAAGSVVVLDVRAGGEACAALPSGHVFGAVRALKSRPGVAVYVVVDSDDAVGPEIARFCLADGSLRFDAVTGSLDTEGVDVAGAATSAARSRGAAVDTLLARVEAELRNSTRGDSALQRLLQFEREDSLLNRLQDPETGLFDGPYATLKLDEEWKRAVRFHQPLSLLLVDLGAGVAELSASERRGLLAEAAGVFLNECRDIDVLARFAPSVFLFLLPGTGRGGAEVVASRILASLRQKFGGIAGIAPAGGLTTVPATGVADRRTFLAVTEACLRRAQAGGAGGLCTTLQ